MDLSTAWNVPGTEVLGEGFFVAARSLAIVLGFDVLI
jgi:hypothetical protein